MLRVLLISDDLTGALDASAPFAAAGLRTVVAVTPSGIPQAVQAGADVVAVSLNSRERPIEDAAQLAEAAARAFGAVERVFKKIDSRLKGHVGAEVLAVARARRMLRVLLCPAIPDLGRVVRAGRLRGFGVAEPVDVAAASGLTGVVADFPDAESDAALDRVVADAAGDTLLVGARGLASALARSLRVGKGGVGAGGVGTGGVGTGWVLTGWLPEPVTLAIGSRDPITLAQVIALRRARPDLHWLAAPNGNAPLVPDTGGSAIWQVTPGPSDRPGAEVMAAFARGLVARGVAGRQSLILSGGETAAAVLAGMGVQVLELLGEIAPGVPLSRVIDDAEGPWIVTKSGGFGAPGLLCRFVAPEGSV